MADQAERDATITRAFDLPDSLVKRAEELVLEDGVSLDIWMTSALAQKIRAVETAVAFFRRRSAGAGKGLSFYLDRIPDNPPMPGDELPRA
ncbi:MAG: hypothetical protein ABSE99_13865 [Terracidiphilus sp.]|jgi:hypothetical protein